VSGELTLTCLVCGQEVDSELLAAFIRNAPSGCPFCDDDVAEAIRVHLAERRKRVA
jgi:hypothetical protein